jgi:hypothetical protein
MNLKKVLVKKHQNYFKDKLAFKIMKIKDNFYLKNLFDNKI